MAEGVCCAYCHLVTFAPYEYDDNVWKRQHAVVLNYVSLNGPYRKVARRTLGTSDAKEAREE